MSSVPLLAGQGSVADPQLGAQALASDGGWSTERGGIAGRSPDGAARSEEHATSGQGAGAGQAGASTAEGTTGQNGSTGGGAPESLSQDSQEDSSLPTEAVAPDLTPDDAIAMLGMSDGGGDRQDSETRPGQADGGDAQADTGADGTAWMPDADGTVTSASEEEDGALQADGASALSDPDDRDTSGEAAAGSGRGTMTPQDKPTIASLDDDKIWNPFTAGAGTGGINDASATEETVAQGSRDRYQMAEAWVDSRKQESAEGRIQTTEDGQSGGRSSLAYQEAYDAYSGLAEAAVAAEALPPGRRALIQRYFEAIQPEEETPSP
jgi:hypothetical protein